jgi:Ca-activated chloride channel family protein
MKLRVRLLLGLVCGLGLAAFCLAQRADSAPRGFPSPPPQASDAAEIPTIQVNVNLVNVFVTVLDEKNAPVAGLKQEDFTLYEDGHPEKIAIFERESQLPLSIVLAIDSSLSTRKDLALELESARRFARAMVRPVDRVAVYQFSEMVEEVVPFTADPQVIDRGIRGIHAGGATAMYDAIYLASDALRDQRGRKVLVIITDGGDTISKVKYQEALRAAQQAEATVYSIIVVPVQADAGRNIGGEHALIQLSGDTGGKHYYAASIANLDRAFHQISDELRTQYRLAYYPARRVADSDFRRIAVDVQAADAGKLRARHRTGYYTSKFK